MIYFSYINIRWNYLLYEVVERAVPLILWYSRYILLCCSTENQYLSYNFYLFLPYNGGSTYDDNTILSNNVDAWDPVPIYMSGWAVRSTHRSFWCLRNAIIIMSSRKKIQFLKFFLSLILMFALGKHQNEQWVHLTIQPFILPLVILWVLVFGFWAIFPRTTTPYPSTMGMFILLTHFCISRSLSKSF